jgi:hypothetical protein
VNVAHSRVHEQALFSLLYSGARWKTAGILQHGRIAEARRRDGTLGRTLVECTDWGQDAPTDDNATPSPLAPV